MAVVDDGGVDAAIHHIDNADWRKLKAHMALFPKSVCESVLKRLDDLFDREDRDVNNIDDVRYAVSFAKLQVWLIAEELGYDLVGAGREDFWSFISSADSIMLEGSWLGRQDSQLESITILSD